MINFLKQRKLRLLLPFLLLSMMTVVAFAQDDAGNVLVPDVPVTGTIDEANSAQVFTFNAAAGDTIALTASGQAGFPLTLILTDAQGQTLGQSVDSLGNGQIDLSGVIIPSDGSYFVAVFVTAGVPDAILTGSFNLTLSILIPGVRETPPSTFDNPTPEPEETEVVAPTEEVTEVAEDTTPVDTTPVQPIDFSVGQITTSTGIQVNLNWDSPDDLNLQVRDPAGETLYWDSRTTSNGGTFGFDINGLCEVTNAIGNTETANWPGGPVATGSYEILVYYRQSCEGLNPVNFSVDVTVDGQVVDTIAGTLFPSEGGQESVFISSFVINDDSTVNVGAAGSYAGLLSLSTPVQEILDAPAQTIALDAPVEGVITSEQYFQTYQFSGTTGELVSISMERNLGSLDTLLLVFDSAGNIVASNDDQLSAINTDSVIASFLLPASDVYTIYATRYGKDVGGTQGTFILTVSGQAVAGSLPQNIVDLQLPVGDVQVILTWNTDADLRLLVRDPQLNSIYNDQRIAPTGGTLNSLGNVNCTVATTEFPVTDIYWPSGFLLIGSYEVDIWHRSECNNFSPVNFTLYVVVRGQLVLQESGVIEFDTRFITNFQVLDSNGTATRGAAGFLGGSQTITTTLPYQDELATATTITAGQAIPGEINGTNAFDVYVYEGSAGDILNIDMQALGTLDTQIFLLDPNGQEIGANDDASEGTTNSLIGNVLLTQDGTYTILATRFGTLFGGTSGGYRLNLRVDN